MKPGEAISLNRAPENYVGGYTGGGGRRCKCGPPGAGPQRRSRPRDPAGKPWRPGLRGAGPQDRRRLPRRHFRRVASGSTSARGSARPPARRSRRAGRRDDGRPTSCGSAPSPAVGEGPEATLAAGAEPAPGWAPSPRLRAARESAMLAGGGPGSPPRPPDAHGDPALAVVPRPCCDRPAGLFPAPSYEKPPGPPPWPLRSPCCPRPQADPSSERPLAFRRPPPLWSEGAARVGRARVRPPWLPGPSGGGGVSTGGAGCVLGPRGFSRCKPLDPGAPEAGTTLERNQHLLHPGSLVAASVWVEGGKVQRPPRRKRKLLVTQGQMRPCIPLL
uniref:Skin secretory protein xP2-like n=1 Tax=Callorhinus ursinus TaxID=34884 RepID=A0A3Q7MUG6_CALUR|nr:skin secretory protein xP2-like [Callorhinus ursinus]